MTNRYFRGHAARAVLTSSPVRSRRSFFKLQLISRPNKPITKKKNIDSLTIIQPFLGNKGLTAEERKLIKAGGLPGAAFVLDQVSWKDVERLTKMKASEMIRSLMSNQEFKSLLSPSALLVLEDLYLGTSPNTI